MSTGAARDLRPLIFFAVLLFHAAFVLLAIRLARQPIYLSMPMSESLVFLLLPHNSNVIPHASVQRKSADQRPLATPESGASKPAEPIHDVPIAVPAQPKIDWDKESELAAQDALANAGTENGYRDLSALSPEQLSWVRQNHLEPAKPGIAWKYRRVEIAEGGFPIIHINDHCVLIPFLMMMVFCQIGHIEPNGKLFEHMRDPQP